MNGRDRSDPDGQQAGLPAVRPVGSNRQEAGLAPVPAVMVMLTSNNGPDVAPERDATRGGGEPVPAVVRDAGPRAVESYLGFFAQLARLRSKAVVYHYRSAVPRFLAWCEDSGVALAALQPDHVSAFVEAMMGRV